MKTHRWSIAAIILAAVPAAALGQSRGYWVVAQAAGTWEYRVAQGAPREVTGKYDYLVPAGEVRCLEADVRRCELKYLTDPRSGATRKLPVQVTQSGRWVSLKNLTPPPPPVLPMTADALAAKFKRVTQAGGSRAGSGCGGDLPLRAPVCGENVDVGGLVVRWLPPAEPATGRLAILVELVDGRTDVFRASAPASSGEYADARLTDFLRRIQDRNNPVDVTVTVMGDGGRSARRLVHVPPSSETNEYESRIKELTTPDPVLTSVGVMSLALDKGMWSRAAEEGLRLIEFAVGYPRLLEHALAGLCQSDLEEERSRLRKSLPEATYSRICRAVPARAGGAPTASAPAAGVPAVAEAVPGAPAPAPAEAAAGAPARLRLGVALLIGNWDYWNLPLNSVRYDLQNMKDALQAAGFAVSVSENLKGPRQFADALDTALREHQASADDVLLVYFSGHGLQLDGKAHLLGTGVSSTPQVAEDVRANAQSAESLLANMERAIPGTRILIVEACRDTLFSASGGTDAQVQRAGFAFQQDDVPNTFVMFANKPGLPTPARSDSGLMGPFTDALVYALQNSTGEILDVFAVAARKTAEMSPGQEPVLHRSKVVEPVVLRPRGMELQDTRARDLLNGAEALYRDRAWSQFLANVSRGKVLASSPQLQERLAREVDFGTLVKEAELLEEDRNWSDAAARWQKAADLFPARQWVRMKSAVAWLMVDDLPRAVRSLAVIAAQSENETVLQAKQLLGDLLKAFPAYQEESRKAAEEAGKVPDVEFEVIRQEGQGDA